MKPETILQSDLLDIIFENRNKEYGAYELRKTYNTRIIQALILTVLLVGLFILLQSLKPAEKEVAGFFPPDITVTDYVNLKEEPKEPEKQKPAPQKQIKSVVHNIPVIKPDVEVPETTVEPDEVLQNANIGNKKSDGDEIKSGDPFNSSGESSTLVVKEPVAPEPDENIVRDHADIMPSFNGDIVRFMLRHLRQPEDIDEGTRIVVRVKFVVTREGEISDVQVIQSGRSDLDEEVIRVVKKMPRWNPGKQAGKFVPVYFNLPVTFVSNIE
jgi:periplasmic protein TonB